MIDINSLNAGKVSSKIGAIDRGVKKKFSVDELDAKFI